MRGIPSRQSPTSPLSLDESSNSYSSNETTDTSASSSFKLGALMKVHGFYVGLFSLYMLVTQLSSIHPDLSAESVLQEQAQVNAKVMYGLRSGKASASPVVEQNKRALTIPSCAQGLFVDLFNELDEFVCSGLLLRDDLVLADTACAMEATTAVVIHPDEPYLLYHNQTGATLAPRHRTILSKKSIQGPTTVVEIEMPPVHYQSGWPRKRMFVLDMAMKEDQQQSQSDDDIDFMLQDSSTRVLQLDGGESFHLLCVGGDMPVVALPRSVKDVKSSTLLGNRENNDGVFFFPHHHPNKVRPMSNKLGEKWWVPRRRKAVLLKQLLSRKKLYIATDPNTTVDVIRAMGDDALVEAEDPKLRNYVSLKEYFKVWKNQEPFSGEPFYQWLDFGSGRSLPSESYDRAEIEEDYCEAMDDAARAKAVVIPQIKIEPPSDDDDADSSEETVDIFLRYEQADLPVEGGYLLFVWGLDEKLYVYPSGGTQFHHIGFFRAMPVRLAGEVYVGTHGKLEEIWNDSGHYKPKDAHFRLLYRHLKAMFPEMSPYTVRWVNEYTKLEKNEWPKFHFGEDFHFKEDAEKDSVAEESE